jgi:hypothetical protein
MTGPTPELLGLGKGFGRALGKPNGGTPNGGLAVGAEATALGAWAGAPEADGCAAALVTAWVPRGRGGVGSGLTPGSAVAVAAALDPPVVGAAATVAEGSGRGEGSGPLEDE